VPLSTPAPGLVIRYSYLWHAEHIAGRVEGGKDRPTAIIAAIKTKDAGEARVLVLPITHTAPARDVAAVEIPATIKRRLGLDADGSWIMLTEWNEFVWPGPDLRRIPGSDAKSVAFGFLTPLIFCPRPGCLCCNGTCRTGPSYPAL
jgi:hypothetical protein